MIQFQMFDHQPERCEKYHQMLKDNLPAVSLYEKMGYRTESLKKSILMRLAGIKAMYIMKKKLR